MSGHLTSGQKAALTRAANKANGTSGPATGATISPRAAGLSLELWITEQKDSKSALVFFKPVSPDGQWYGSGLADNEMGLPELRWIGSTDGETGEVGTSREAYHYGTLLNARDLQQCLPLMTRTDKLLSAAYESSEDPSFAFVCQTLANHFRASTLKVQSHDGKVSEYKRGATYITVLRLSDAMVGRVRDSKPKPSPKA